MGLLRPERARVSYENVNFLKTYRGPTPTRADPRPRPERPADCAAGPPMSHLRRAASRCGDDSPPLTGMVRCARPSHTTRHDRPGLLLHADSLSFTVARRPSRSGAFEHTGRRPQPSTPAPPHPTSAFLTARVGPRPPRGPSHPRPLLTCPGPRNRHTIPIARGDHTRWPAVQFNGAFPPSGQEGASTHVRHLRAAG